MDITLAKTNQNCILEFKLNCLSGHILTSLRFAIDIALARFFCQKYVHIVERILNEILFLDQIIADQVAYKALTFAPILICQK